MRLLPTALLLLSGCGRLHAAASRLALSLEPLLHPPLLRPSPPCTYPELHKSKPALRHQHHPALAAQVKIQAGRINLNPPHSYTPAPTLKTRPLPRQTGKKAAA